MTARPLTFVIALALAAACGKPEAPAQPAPTPTAAAPGGAPPAVDAVGEAAASYRVVAAIAPASVARGGKATLTVDIEMTRPDVHVQREFPLKLSLKPGAGLSAAKELFGHPDALDPEAKGRRWQIPLAAKDGGRQEVEVALRFALCKETEPLWCVTRNETVRAGVDVR